MSANFDGTNAESQPNKNTKDINNSKNKKDTSNKEQISEKKQTEQRKNKSWADCSLTDHQKSPSQTEDSEWTLTVSNKRKDIQRPLMEVLYICNTTKVTTDEEIWALLGLDGTTYLRENSSARKEYTDNGGDLLGVYMCGCPNSL